MVGSRMVWVLVLAEAVVQVALPPGLQRASTLAEASGPSIAQG